MTCDEEMFLVNYRKVAKQDDVNSLDSFKFPWWTSFAFFDEVWNKWKDPNINFEIKSNLLASLNKISTIATTLACHYEDYFDFPNDLYSVIYNLEINSPDSPIIKDFIDSLKKDKNEFVRPVIHFFTRLRAEAGIKEDCIAMAQVFENEFKSTKNTEFNKLAKYYLKKLVRQKDEADTATQTCLRPALLPKDHYSLLSAIKATEKPSHVVLHSVAQGKDADEERSLKIYHDIAGAALPLVDVTDWKTLQEVLDFEFPWLKSVTGRICDKLGNSYILNNGFYLPPILLSGPPGCGKTRYARRIAELIMTPFLLIAVGGRTDNRALVGTARGWGTSYPGQVIELIARTKVPNPIILLDELDKEGDDTRNGRLSDSLLQLLERENAAHWVDECLRGKCDLTKVVWFATANNIKHISRSLLSRFEIVEVPMPTKSHMLNVIHCVRNDYIKQHNLETYDIPQFSDGDWEYLTVNSKSTRHAVRLTEALIALKLKNMRKLQH